MNSIKIPASLIDDIKAHKCVLFVGAGLSRQSGLPLWEQFFEKILARCEQEEIVLPERMSLAQLLNKKNFLDAAQYIKDILPDGQFYRMMTDIFDNDQLEPSPAHLLLPDIPFASIITTNYDRLIEKGYAKAKRDSIRVITHVDTTPLLTLLKRGEFYLLKAHGTIINPHTIILGKKTYDTLMRKSEHYISHIETVFRSKTVLFVGCSLTDPDLRMVLEEELDRFKGQPGEHYALMNMESLNPIEARTWEKDFGIQIIPYLPSDISHPEVEDFLRNLIKALKQDARETLIEPSTNSPVSPETVEAPAAYDEREILFNYLGRLLRENRSLELTGYGHLQATPSVELERVYVALKANRTTLTELTRARDLIAMYEDEHVGASPGNLTPFEKRLLDAFIMQEFSVDTLSPILDLHGKTTTLSEAFKRERWMVLLGSPGSGKTTLARWLTLKLARAFEAFLQGKQTRVEVPANQVNPDTPNDTTLIDNGPARLPILVQVADYAAQAAQARNGGKSYSLLQHLGRHKGPRGQREKINPDFLHDIIIQYIKKGQVVVILDGMDEIPAEMSRQDVVRDIQEFRTSVIDYALGAIPADVLPWDSIFKGAPHQVGGNQLIVTSRVVGYRATAIEHMAHFEIQPMKRTAVEHFCNIWVTTVEQALAQEEKQDQLNAEELARIQERAKEKANGLIKAIYNHPHSGVPALASNPLLVTIIALIYLQNLESLPERRVQLYQQAIEILVKDLRHTARNPEQIISVLSPLAAYMHEECPDGMILLPKLKAKLIEPLRKEFPATNESHDAFIKEMREKVGLLVERGDNRYSFLHRTFQEYLTGRYLLSSDAINFENISKYLSDPSWREPFLLALGYASWQGTSTQLEELVRIILAADVVENNVIPNGTLLVVEALHELEGLEERTIQDVLLRLIKAYADLRAVQASGNLPQHIENTFLRLRASRLSNSIEATLIRSLTDPLLAPAAATLIRKQEWFTSDIVKALFEAAPFDSAEWNWPIQTSLRELASPKVPRRQIEKPAPPQPEELQEFYESNPAKATRLETLYEVEARMYELHELRESQVYRAKIPVNMLSVRAEITDDVSQQEHIKLDLKWIMLLLALCGGYADHKGDEVPKEYASISAFLQKSDAEREAIIDEDPEFFASFGYDDIVYNMAVYLDAKMDGRLEFSQAQPRFTPEAIYREPKISELIKKGLRAKISAEVLTGNLWGIWNDANSSDMSKADAAVALVALGQPIIEVLKKSLSTEEKRKLARLILKNLEQLSNALRDPIARARPIILKQLAGVDIKSDQIGDTLLALRQLFVLFSSIPVSFSTLTAEACAIPYSAISLADNWHNTFSGKHDDNVYKSAVLLDTLPEVNKLIELLLYANLAPHVSFSETEFKWATAALPPRLTEDDQDDVPPEVLSNVDNLSISHIRYDLNLGLRSEILKRLCRRAKNNSDLVPVLLAYSYPQCQPVIMEVAEALPIDFYHAPIKLIAQMARRVSNPYYKARSLIYLLPHVYQLDERREKVIEEILLAARSISDAHQRTRVWEMLIPILRFSSLFNADEEAILSARAIVDAENKVRALVRLSFFLPIEQRTKLQLEALEIVGQIPDRQRKYQTLQELYQVLPFDEDLHSQFDEIAQAAPSAWYQAKVKDAIRLELAARPPAFLDDFIKEESEAWAPILLGGAVSHALEYFGTKIELDSLWNQLGETGAVEAQRRLINQGAQKGLILTYEAAMALDKLKREDRKDIAKSLLSLVKSPTTTARRIIEPWEADTHDVVFRTHALLLKAEDRRILTSETIPAIYDLLKGDDDLARYRAMLVIGTPIWSIEKERSLKVSEIEQEALELLVSFCLRTDTITPFAWTALARIFCDLVFDSEEQIEKWVAKTQTDAEGADEALFVLGHIEELSGSKTIDKFNHFLRNGSLKVKRALFTSICRMSVAKKMTDEIWAKIAPTLQGMDFMGLEEERFHLEPLADILAALTNARDTDHKLSDEELAAHADQYFTKECSKTLPELIALKESELKSALGEIGNTYYRWLDSVDREAEEASIEIQNKPYLFSVLLHWLLLSLKDGLGKTNEEIEKQSWLLRISSVVAQQMPTEYLVISKKTKLKLGLLKIVSAHPHAWARRAAIRLLSYLRDLDEEVAENLLYAMRDDKDVQLETTLAIGRFTSFNSRALNVLTSALMNDGALIAYGAARLLVYFAQNSRSTISQKQRIIQSLAKAAKDPKAQRGVYILRGQGGIEDDPVKVHCLIQLDQAFYQALIELSGVI